MSSERRPPFIRYHHMIRTVIYSRNKHIKVTIPHPTCEFTSKFQDNCPPPDTTCTSKSQTNPQRISLFQEIHISIDPGCFCALSFLFGYHPSSSVPSPHKPPVSLAFSRVLKFHPMLKSDTFPISSYVVPFKTQSGSFIPWDF